MLRKRLPSFLYRKFWSCIRNLPNDWHLNLANIVMNAIYRFQPRNRQCRVKKPSTDRRDVYFCEFHLKFNSPGKRVLLSVRNKNECAFHFDRQCIIHPLVGESFAVYFFDVHVLRVHLLFFALLWTFQGAYTPQERSIMHNYSDYTHRRANFIIKINLTVNFILPVILIVTSQSKISQNSIIS